MKISKVNNETKSKHGDENITRIYIFYILLHLVLTNYMWCLKKKRCTTKWYITFLATGIKKTSELYGIIAA